MELGERIYTLRSARGLSQSDLADALEVSRQSISKWETGGSVPELDKLMKLSRLFGVTLDELVTGEAPAQEAPEPQEHFVREQTPEPETRKKGQTIAAVTLLWTGILISLLLWMVSGSPAGLLLASPFFLCAAICFAVRRRAGLWCAWAAGILADVYLGYATGIRWQTIFLTLQWTPQQNYVRLAVAWGMFAGWALLVLATVLCYRKQPLERTRKTIVIPAVCAAAWVALHLPIWSRVPYFVTSFVLQWARVILLSAALTGWVRLRAAKK